jgi:hypothetical protein
MTELLGLSTIPFLLAMLAWTPVVVLLHELGHAAAALHATRGEVRVVVGSEGGMRVKLERLELRLWPIPVALPVGMCEYEPATLSRPRAEAWIALAGPMASLLWAVLLARLASAASGGVAAGGGGAAACGAAGAATATAAACGAGGAAA